MSDGSNGNDCSAGAPSDEFVARLALRALRLLLKRVSGGRKFHLTHEVLVATCVAEGYDRQATSVKFAKFLGDDTE